MRELSSIDIIKADSEEIKHGVIDKHKNGRSLDVKRYYEENDKEFELAMNKNGADKIFSS